MAGDIHKYWVYLGGSVQGPVECKDILNLPGFKESTLVCPEEALGQWREASAEPSLKERLAANKKIAGVEEAESLALQTLLAQALNKASALEQEISGLHKKHSDTVKLLEEQLRSRDKSLEEFRLKLEKAQAVSSGTPEHPSWEVLYRTYKNRAEGKLRHMAEQLGGREAELLQVRRQFQETTEKHGADEHARIEFHEKTVSGLKMRIISLEARLEEREAELKTHKEKLRSALERAAEMRDLMLEEKESVERQSQNLSGEIGKYKSQLAWKERELALFKETCAEKAQACKELESRETLRRKEQEDANRRIRAKLSQLNDYLKSFESLKENIQSLLEKMSGRIYEQYLQLSRRDKAGAEADPSSDKPVATSAHDDILSMRRENARINDAIVRISDEIKDIHSSLENI